MLNRLLALTGKATERSIRRSSVASQRGGGSIAFLTLSGTFLRSGGCHISLRRSIRRWFVRWFWYQVSSTALPRRMRIQFDLGCTWRGTDKIAITKPL